MLVKCKNVDRYQQISLTNPKILTHVYRNGVELCSYFAYAECTRGVSKNLAILYFIALLSSLGQEEQSKCMKECTLESTFLHLSLAFLGLHPMSHWHFAVEDVKVAIAHLLA